MHFKMNDMLKNVSETHRRLQKQFFKSLVLQVNAISFTVFGQSITFPDNLSYTDVLHSCSCHSNCPFSKSRMESSNWFNRLLILYLSTNWFSHSHAYCIWLSERYHRCVFSKELFYTSKGIQVCSNIHPTFLVRRQQSLWPVMESCLLREQWLKMLGSHNLQMKLINKIKNYLCSHIFTSCAVLTAVMKLFWNYTSSTCLSYRTYLLLDS